jgi:hypothetical protein
MTRRAKAKAQRASYGPTLRQQRRTERLLRITSSSPYAPANIHARKDQGLVQSLKHRPVSTTDACESHAQVKFTAMKSGRAARSLKPDCRKL